MFSQKSHMFGYFVIPYVACSFVLALIGFSLLCRYIWIKGSYHILSLYYWSRGYNPFEYWEFSFHTTFLFFLATIFFVLAIGYYNIGFNHSEEKKTGLGKIIVYSALYRSLYTVPLILALYKLARGDIRWYTK